MRILKPSYKIIPNGVDTLKKIEMIARVCYKSESKIKEDSAPKLVSALIKRGHEAMLEHGSFCFQIDRNAHMWFTNTIAVLEETTNFKSYLSISVDGRILISGNVRAWRSLLNTFAEMHRWIPIFMKEFVLCNPTLFPELQQGVQFGVWEGYMKPISDKELITKQEKLKHQRLSVLFVVDRGISHEIVRHRPASFAQESTRYCNYMKNDFGGEITVIKPFFLEEGTYGYDVWNDACKSAEAAYFDLLNWGCTPQQARIVLPTDLKTEVVMTATLSEWIHFFNLRALGTTGEPHPQMKEVALPLYEEIKSYEPIVFDKESEK